MSYLADVFVPSMGKVDIFIVGVCFGATTMNILFIIAMWWWDKR